MPSRALSRSSLILAVAIAGIAAAPAVAARPVSAGKPPGLTTTTIQAAPTSTTTTTTAAPPTSTGSTIVFSDRYRAFMALFPSGWAPNACEAEVALSGRPGVCTAEYAPVTMYPDGSYGTWPWYIDPSSSTGWSIDNPCDDPNVVEYDVWAAYVDWFNYGVGYDTGLTDDQIAASGACFGWWW